MKSRIDWLDGEIERMHAGRRLSTAGLVDVGEPGEAIAILQMAARLNSLRPGALEPDPGFLAGLRDRVLVACEEAEASHGPPILGLR